MNNAIDYAQHCNRSHDAVIRRKARVNDISRDYPSRVDGPGHAAVIGACAFPRNVQGDDGTVRITHEAVRRIARVRVQSRDQAARVDGHRLSALEGVFARTRCVECDNGVGSQQPR